ncbi:hypothetical protein JXZ92_00850 [Mycoplasma sp. CSL10137]|uniref:hypothetical protein n=1 Tax=Mycoplasma sp. CSL10137 TaxID=2813824 RepID=UPI00197C4E14|nr:hypothetical protein [Mycoplasma sp. CSL10137]MBN4083372.1 hypothetical protein [Mycoplasma sp. CSL10137]
MKKIFLKKYYSLLAVSIIPVFVTSTACANNNYDKNKTDDKLDKNINTDKENNKNEISDDKKDNPSLNKESNDKITIEQKQNKKISTFKKYLNLSEEKRKIYDNFFLGMFTLPWGVVEKIDKTSDILDNSLKPNNEENNKQEIDKEPLKYGITTILKTKSSVILNLRLEDDSSKYDFWTFPTKEEFSHRLQKSNKKSSKTPNNTIWITFDLSDYLNRTDSENLRFFFYYNINNGEYKKLEFDKKVIIKNKEIVIE